MKSLGHKSYWAQFMPPQFNSYHEVEARETYPIFHAIAKIPKNTFNFAIVDVRHHFILSILDPFSQEDKING